MAYVVEPTGEMREEWGQWVASRPESVRRAIEEHELEPWKLYRIKSSGHRVVIHCFDEHQDGSVTIQVDVDRRFNFVTFERRVFGVAPGDLEECDLPAAGEPLGALLTHDEARAAVDGVDGAEAKMRAVRDAADSAVEQMARGSKA
jgi:hypothetical protein